MHNISSAIIICSFLFLSQTAFSQAGENFNTSGNVLSECSDEPLFKIGLIADPQYCDCEPGSVRYFRETLWKLPEAVDSMNKYQVDFVVTLGDLVDQFYESYDAIKPFYDNLEMPYYHLLGNHEFYEITNEQMTTLTVRYNMPGYYYDFSYNGWRFIVLDGTELAEYSRYLHPELAAEGDSVWNSVQGQIIAETWNGGISKAQQLWMRSKIEEAASQEQNVILFCHFTLYPEGIQNSLWNKEEIISLLNDYPNVIAYINGHTHEGSYGFKSPIHYIGLKAMVDTPDKNSFAILEVYPKELRIKGFGNISDSTFKYSTFKQKYHQLALSDSIINYSKHTGDFVGKISHTTDGSATLAVYFLYGSQYNNDYFAISGDSLLLNTEEDISEIGDLKISVVLKDCDADTFSRVFNILFDTTVMKFRYTLPDTLLSVYTDYSINMDSLIDDFSRYGMGISLSLENASLMTYFIYEDSIYIIPKKVGHTKITLTAADTFTGKSFQQIFNIDVFDPLNHPPYHADSAKTKYIVLLADTLEVKLADIFTDPDNDTLIYYHYLSDSVYVTATITLDILRITGLKPGEVELTIIADDRSGGTDTLRLNILINSRPVRIKEYGEILFQFESGCAEIFLDTIFTDPNGDTIIYNVLSEIDSYEIDSHGNLLLCPSGAGLYMVYLHLDDGKNGFTEDSLLIRFNVKPEAVNRQIQYFFEWDTEHIAIGLDTLFLNEDNDILMYRVSSLQTESFNYSFMGTTLKLYPIVSDTFSFNLIASDSYWGVDSVEIKLKYMPKTSEINTVQLTNLIIFPNPVAGTIKVMFESDVTESLKIFISDLHGKITCQFDNLIAYPGTNICETLINTDLPPGYYFINIANKRGNLLSQEIFINQSFR